MEATTGFHEFKDKVKRNYSPNDKEYPTWMQSVKATLGVLKNRPWDLSIYKVPNELRRLKEDAYNPRIVSIGPFHQHKHELRVMEEHKWRYMLNFLCRGSNAEAALDECGKTISGLEGEARGHYAENINLNKHELVEILLVDGCFILELLIRHAEKDKAKEDPIINNAWMIPTLQHDLILLENQIPFCVLRNLFITIQKISAPAQLPFSLTKYVLLFFRTALNLSEQTVDSASLEIDVDKCKHLLDILHHVYLHKFPEVSPKSQDITWGLRCATQLFRSGIQFQVGGADSMLVVKFSEGVITIPPLGINLESSDFIFRNLIAFEQCSFGGKHHITSYAKLMTCLIRSSQDVELLQRKGIITNKDGGIIEDVSTFFDSLCRGVVFKDFYFSELCEKVDVYQKSRFLPSRVKAGFKVRLNGYMVTLKKDYFTSPWSIISLIAAILLLSFTALQTFYTVHSYYK